MSEWQVTAKEILRSGTKTHELPVKNVLNYRFTNEQGQTFAVNMLDNGHLQVSVDSQLVVLPRSSNLIELEQKGF